MPSPLLFTGVPACANHWAIEELARGTWGFNGYVTGDCSAVQDSQGKYPHSHDFGTKGTASYRDAHGFNITTGRGPNTGVPWNSMSRPAKPLSSTQQLQRIMQS